MKLLSVAEAAEILGVSEKSVRGAISRGELPASKVCGRIRIAKRDLRAWVEANRVTRRETSLSPFEVTARAPRSRRSIGPFAEALRRAEG